MCIFNVAIYKISAQSLDIDSLQLKSMIQVAISSAYRLFYRLF